MMLRMICHEALRLWMDRMTKPDHKKDVESILFGLFRK